MCQVVPAHVSLEHRDALAVDVEHADGPWQIDRIMIASSDKAYGDSERLPYTEDMPLLGRNPYDASKSCADLLSQM